MGLFSRKKQAPAPPQQPAAVEQQPQPPRHSSHSDERPQLHPSPPSYSAGILPPPPYGWSGGPPPGTPPPPPQCHYDQRQYAPIVVNQHYYLGSPPPLHSSSSNPSYTCHDGSGALTRLNLGSAVDLAQKTGCAVNQILDDGLPRWHSYGTQVLNQGAAMFDQIYSNFDRVMTSIDRGSFTGDENDMFLSQLQCPGLSPPPLPAPRARSQPPSEAQRQLVFTKKRPKKTKKGATKAQSAGTGPSSLIPGGYVAKVGLYANSKLPRNLPPPKLYVSDWPLICLAAQYSERVYENPRGAECDTHVDADWRKGTKAMCIKSVPMDHMDTIVFAIRGTTSFMDWAVNLNTAAAAPVGFLDDPSNLCHAGFLSVARRMVAPVAARLRQLLEEDPGRCAHRLLITGHSAGGAVAALLYAHLHAATAPAASELNALAGCFRRVHCVTFGTPPVSRRPLLPPPRPSSSHHRGSRSRNRSSRSLFLSFVNEGDPVARADRAYVRSLLELYAAPAPAMTTTAAVAGAADQPPRERRGRSRDNKESWRAPLPLPAGPGPQPQPPSKRRGRLREKRSKHGLASKTSKTSMAKSSSSSSHSPHSHRPQLHPHTSSTSTTSSSSSKAKPSKQQQPKPARPVWKVPPSTLVNAGRVVVLRRSEGDDDGRRTAVVEDRARSEGEGAVVAQVAGPDDLRGVIWGDPVCHVMRLYAARVETLAVKAVTAQGR
ncbi:Alpha/Beta hydrolase protein [Xylariaceae sp. FL0804]|nr:Alpha/Beta hydrolase protein [Xylariaceae sp. FL0804]